MLVSSDLSPLKPGLYEKPVIPIPDNYIMSVQQVEKQLLKLKTRKAAGPDNIPSWLLKDFADVLAGPIASILNASIAQACVSALWKSADVVPLLKVNPPSKLEKDLPVALTPILATLLEFFACGWLDDMW